MDSGDLFEGSVNLTGPTSFASLRAGRAGARGGLGAADGESRPRPLTRPVCTCRPDAPPPPDSQGARTARRVARGPWHRHLRHGSGGGTEKAPQKPGHHSSWIGSSYQGPCLRSRVLPLDHTLQGWKGALLRRQVLKSRLCSAWGCCRDGRGLGAAGGAPLRRQGCPLRGGRWRALREAAVGAAEGRRQVRLSPTWHPAGQPGRRT